MKDSLIIGEDSDLLVINKPSGLTVNRSDTTASEETLQDLVEEKIEKQGSEEFLSRGGIVHRLDKETSGVILIAKNQFSFEFLQSQFKERDVRKAYLALVHGEIKPANGTISVPVGRLPWNRKRFGVLSGGREAKTDYATDKLYKYENEILSLVNVFPKTGRTHQIRVHMKHIGHPVFGDLLYAGRKTARKDRKILQRLFLHASKISIVHPETKERTEFEAPIPPELQKTLDNLVLYKRR